MRILLTGAHLTPALAMIDFIRQYHPEDELFFVGRLYSQEKLRQQAVEKEEVKKRGVKFIPFQATKFRGNGLLSNTLAVLTFPATVAQAKKILQQEKIDLLLSFGSYLAVPFALAAKALRLPVITHEQTIVLGRANQFIAKLADVVALSYKETARYLSKKNYALTGNPVRQQIFARNLPKPSWLKSKEKKLLLVMGGNQGSLIINDLTKTLLPTLVQDYAVVHQCGRPNLLRDFPKELSALKKTLPAAQQVNYQVKEWISDEELFWCYQHATLAISRAGANAVQELCISQLPAILIPLPHNYNDEQEKNAQLMKRLGGALVLEQEQLDAARLLSAIRLVEQEAEQMRQQLANNYRYRDAAAQLYQLLAMYRPTTG